TPKAVKAAYDLAAGKAPSSHTHPWNQITGVPTASLTAKGITQLSSATNSTSEVLAATPKAVKAAYDLANGKQAADATLTALAALATAADKLPYFTGVDRAALTALTSVGRAILSKPSIQSVLNYLGLGEGSALPVGVPVPWPSATPPTGWLQCNGAPFSAEEYPKLAKAYPKLKLPDLRGEFIRGWDDGRGVDSARLLLSSQAASILEHNHEMHGWTGNPLMARDVYSSGSSVFAAQLSIGDGGLLYSWKDGSGTTNDSKRMYRTNHVSSGAGDGSPRNIAFNYIVRAA
ncbi:phage tail protein, partial [Escherichia coli]|nr:phage tail protein [Escherichia coli]